MENLDMYDMVILHALFTERKVNFSSLEQFQIAKKTRRRHLDKLEKWRLIQSDKTASWRRGQSVNYTLTDKGINSFIRIAGKDVLQAFKTLSGILDVWYKNPDLFKKYRRETCILNQLETDSTDDTIMLPEIKMRLENAIEAFDKREKAKLILSLALFC
jgi:predicted ArsR family transcriptional regulator